MRKLVFCSIPLILLSCNLSEKKKISDNSTENNTNSYLVEGEHEIEINGVKLWYLVRGKGPILIVYPSSAGWGGDCSVYIEYLKPWEEQKTVIYFEPRGLGKSERLDSLSDYTMDKYVEELEQFREKLKIDKFDLYGHCYAGIIASKYAVKYHEHLNHLILMSTFPKSSYPGYAKWEKNRDGYENMIKRNAEIEKEALTGEERIKEEKKSWYTVTFHNYNKHKVKFERIMDKTIFSALPLQQAYGIDMQDFNIIESLKNIKTNTLILYGDNDFPSAVFGPKVIKENIPDSKIVEIKNCCHWAFIEQPDVFFSETIKFLNN